MGPPCSCWNSRGNTVTNTKSIHCSFHNKAPLQQRQVNCCDGAALEARQIKSHSNGGLMEENVTVPNTPQWISMQGEVDGRMFAGCNAFEGSGLRGLTVPVSCGWSDMRILATKGGDSRGHACLYPRQLDFSHWKGSNWGINGAQGVGTGSCDLWEVS